MEILDETEKHGLIHMTDNCREKMGFICNCCTCCCTLLGGITRLGIPGAVTRSDFTCQIDPDRCTACGACEERCPVHAISEVEKGCFASNRDKCLGCGLCASACDFDAIRLERTRNEPPPGKDVGELMTIMGKERGKRAGPA